MSTKEAVHTKELGELLEFHPVVVFVVIGGSDITESCVPADVFRNIMALVETIKDAGTERVYVTEILHRGAFPNAPEMTEKRFNSIRSSINKKICKTFGQVRVKADDIKFPKHYEDDLVYLRRE
ncbi:hypothetical protein FSP39_002503 [Pinctada imbricata]|uniref:SGNH hydrolase-type esterase domain-containing protein n=1 Tax=Pinctada imbricata TaxID=66713 RepID=A0AA88XYI3_PINIB|nr:hypothetical protein FSP39_002503 [Pinctada imbricata]